MTGAYVRRRPILLSVVTILMIVAGLLSIISGIIVIALRNNDDFRVEVNETSGTITSIGVGAIISGVIAILLASALRRGSRIARALVAIYFVLHIVAAIVALIVLDHNTYLAASIVTIAIDVLILYYLYGTQGAREFFGT